MGQERGRNTSDNCKGVSASANGNDFFADWELKLSWQESKLETSPVSIPRFCLVPSAFKIETETATLPIEDAAPFLKFTVHLKEEYQ